MKNYAIIHHQKARDERREILMQDIPHERWKQMENRHTLPAGSWWSWATQIIYGPKGSADQKKTG